MKRGLLLFAHGARDARWADPFEAVAHRARTLDPTLDVRIAFLEFMTPTLREAGDALVAAGCGRVDVVPLFLGTGGHVRKDLPLLLDEMAAAHVAVQWKLRPAIGESALVVEAMAAAAIQSMSPSAA